MDGSLFDTCVRKALGVLHPRAVPTRTDFLSLVVQQFSERMTAVAEFADSATRPVEPGIAILTAHVVRLVDEVCESGTVLRWPFPGSTPAGFGETLTDTDLAAMGEQFQREAFVAIDRDVARTFADAAHALLAAADARTRPIS